MDIRACRCAAQNIHTRYISFVKFCEPVGWQIRTLDWPGLFFQRVVAERSRGQMNWPLEADARPTPTTLSDHRSICRLFAQPWV